MRSVPFGAAGSLLLILAMMVVSVSCLSPSAVRQPALLAPEGPASSTSPTTTSVDSPREPAGLNTYALTAQNVDVETGVGGGRQGTTRVRVKLTGNQLQQAMPVVSADPAKGLVHDVLDSFRFLKVGMGTDGCSCRCFFVRSRLDVGQLAWQLAKSSEVGNRPHR